MDFNESIIRELRKLNSFLNKDEGIYLKEQEALSKKFVGKESDLEDIIYDYKDSDVRLEAMMVCKIMPTMQPMRIFNDLSIAETDPEIKKWAGILFRQEHLLEIIKIYRPNKKGDAEQLL